MSKRAREDSSDADPLLQVHSKPRRDDPSAAPPEPPPAQSEPPAAPSEPPAAQPASPTVDWSDLCIDMLASALLPRLPWNDRLSLSRVTRQWRTCFFNATRAVPAAVTPRLPAYLWDMFRGIDTLNIAENNSHHTRVSGSNFLCHVLREKLTALCLTDVSQCETLFASLSRLTTLKLRNCFASERHTSGAFAHLTRLTTLVLDRTNIEASADALRAVSLVEVLDIRGTKIRCADLHVLPRLRRLRLSECNAVDAAGLVALPETLEVLKIENTTTDFRGGLHALKNVNTLRVQNANWFSHRDAVMLPKLRKLACYQCGLPPRYDKDAHAATAPPPLEKLDILTTDKAVNLAAVKASFPLLTYLRVDALSVMHVEYLAELKLLTDIHLCTNYYESYRFLDDILLGLGHLKCFTLCEHMRQCDTNDAESRLVLAGSMRERPLTVATPFDQCPWAPTIVRPRIVYDVLYDLEPASRDPDPPSQLSVDFLSDMSVMLFVMPELLKGRFLYGAKRRGIDVSLCIMIRQ